LPHLALTASPSDVTRALAAVALDWRESRLPESLRRAGVHGLTYRPRGDGRFRLTLDGVRSRLGARCDGQVASDGAGAVVSYEVSPVLDPLTVFLAVLVVAGGPAVWDIWTGEGAPTALAWPLLGASFLAGVAAIEAARLRTLLEPGVRALLAAAAEGTYGARAI
jgi:hypothetical protein